MGVDVLFIVPSTKPYMKDESIGTLILAKKASMAGFNAKIVRYWEVDSKLDDYHSFCNNMIDFIKKNKPAVLAFYCRCSEYHICLDLSMRIKDVDPSIRVALGGPQAELVAKETLKYYPFIDFVCCSEGENTIVPFLNCIIRNNEGNTLSSIPGLTYRAQNGAIIQNHFPDFLPDDYVRGYNYYDLIPHQIMQNNNGANIDVGRGCPFSCTFCSTKTFWKRKYRLRNIEDIVNEIEWLLSNYGIRNYCFDHDLFTVNSAKITEFCKLIMSKGLDIEWYCSSRTDTISKELINIMHDAGCYKILYGIETGSPRMQRLINKNLNLERCESIVKYTLEKGMKVVASFIYGLPEETEIDFEQSFELMQKLQSLGARAIAWRCGILNGTELFEKYKSNLAIEYGNVCNSSFFGFDELFPMIKEHKDVFPHFCDYHTNLRSELVYLEIFRSIWNYFDPNIYNQYLVIF